VRGSPIKEWIMFSVLWLLLVIPAIKLTLGQSHPPHPAQTTASVTECSVPATAVIRYTGAPSQFRVLQQGKVLCSSNTPLPGGSEYQFTLQLTENSAELNLQADWPDNQEHVFEIELIVDNLEEQRARRWAQKKLDDVVSFEW